MIRELVTIIIAFGSAINVIDGGSSTISSSMKIALFLLCSQRCVSTYESGLKAVDPSLKYLNTLLVKPPDFR